MHAARAPRQWLDDMKDFALLKRDDGTDEMDTASEAGRTISSKSRDGAGSV